MISEEDWAEIRQMYLAGGMPIKATGRKLRVVRQFDTWRGALGAAAAVPAARQVFHSGGVEPQIRALLKDFS